MPCDCEKARKEQDGGNDDKPKSCPDGQKFDADAGKCVPASGEKGKKESTSIGDPKAQSVQGELPASPQNGGATGEELSVVEPQTCPEGHVYDADMDICVPASKKDPGDGQTQGTDKTASVESNKKLEQSLKVLHAKLDTISNLKATEKKPTVQVGKGVIGSEKNRYLSLDEVAKEYVEAIGEGRNYVFHLPLENFRAVNVGKADPKSGVQEAYRGRPVSLQEAWKQPNQLIKEAVVISGTHATQDLDTDVAIVPGGISFIPVFQFAKVKQVEQGMDRARFFKTTLPANGSQTVGSTPSQGTQTLTSIEVVPSTISGVYLVGDYDEIENSPFDLLQAIVEASAASYDDFVATDMLDTVSKEGTLTAGLWIRADTGATITSSDIASVAFDETGIAFGREHLENQGYLRGGIKPVCVMHPKQWRQLITSTNVTSLATRSTPDIWLKAQLEELFGVQLVVSNAVEAKNNTGTDAYNALMFVPKHSYGIAVKRDVTVKFHDIGEDNQVRVNTTWRTKSGVLDATSIVRISSSQ